MNFKELILTEFGYEVQTTFWEDFSIADHFGLNAIQDTYNRAFAEWKNNHIYLTELVMVLNWKIWQHYDKNEKLVKLYDSLWKKTQSYAYKSLKGQELAYFITTTD